MVYVNVILVSWWMMGGLFVFRVLPLRKAAKEKAQAIRAAAAASFKAMLQEQGDITVNSRWSRVWMSFE